MMADKNALQQAYAFFHQKLKVYEHSPSERERDHIEDSISRYADAMSPALFAWLSAGKADFLHEHSSFLEDLKGAVEAMEHCDGLQ